MQSESLIRKFAESNATDISSHLPNLAQVCYKYLSNLKESLVVHLGLGRGDVVYIFNELSKQLKINQVIITKKASCVGRKQVNSRTPDMKGKSYLYTECDLDYASKHKSECDKHGFRHPIDILFIDCNHLYEHTLEELRTYVPLLSPSGMIILHDTNMCPLQPNFGWKLHNGQVIYGGWDNKRGVAHALETYFGIIMLEDQDFAMNFKHAGLLWSISHDSLCNGMTFLKKNAADIPIYLIVHNNLADLKKNIQQLHTLNEQLVILDNHSTDSDLLDYYISDECTYRIIRSDQTLLPDSKLIEKYQVIFPKYFRAISVGNAEPICE